MRRPTETGIVRRRPAHALAVLLSSSAAIVTSSLYQSPPYGEECQAKACRVRESLRECAHRQCAESSSDGGDYRWPNNDGIDPDSTLNMTISNSWIDVGDDAICPKARTGCKAGVQGSCYKHGLSNLLVVNNVARSRSSALQDRLDDATGY